MNEDKFEIFAIVELFGHTRVAGKCSEHNFGAATFLRVDVPETKTSPKFTRLVNPSAIYAINPVTEEVCNHMAELISVKPIQAWDIREMSDKILKLQAGKLKPNDDEDDDEDDNRAIF